MSGFLVSNWVWILLIGAMVVMHLGHRHGRGGGMGCGGGHQSHDGHTGHGEPSDQRPDHHNHPGPVHADNGDEEQPPAPARRHGGC